MMHTAYLSLGSNQGERIQNLKSAIHMLQNQKDIEVNCMSSVYETTPVDYESQPDFLNMVCQIYTSLEPYALLDATQRIEDILGRKRKERFGPRVIDIDILMFDDIEIENERLILPHPRMRERAFVMIPLSEIDGRYASTSVLKGEIKRIGKMYNLLDSCC